MARTSKHLSDSVDKAMALLSIHYECVVILASRYDPTAHVTAFVEATEGSDFSVRGHVEEFLEALKNGGPRTGCCPDCCDCGDDRDGDDDEPIDGDEADEADDIGNH